MFKVSASLIHAKGMHATGFEPHWSRSGMIFLRNLWLSGTFISDCKHAGGHFV